MRLLTQVESSFAVCRAVSKRSWELMLSYRLYDRKERIDLEEFGCILRSRGRPAP
jgi:hypothetical protein